MTLRSLDPSCLAQRLVLPPSGSTALLNAALVAQCKVLLRYPRLQKLLTDRWAIVMPQARPGAANRTTSARQRWAVLKTSTSARRGSVAALSVPPGVRFAYDLAYNLLLLVGEAVYPPLGEWIHWRREQDSEVARLAVLARNPEPEDFDSGVKAFYLDGVIVSMAFSIRSKEEQAAKRDLWLRKRAALAQEEARLADVRWPLFRPLGLFGLQLAAKLTIASLLSALPAIGKASMGRIAFLFVCVSQQLWNELAVVFSPRRRLWATETFNPVELTGIACCVAGLAGRILVETISSGLDGDGSGGGEGEGKGGGGGAGGGGAGGGGDPPIDAFALAAWHAHIARGSQALLSVGLMLEWMSQWCRLLQVSQTFGPLVLMSIEMVKDCYQFLVLLSGVFLSFAVALVTLVKPIYLGAQGGLTPLDDGQSCADLFADGFGLGVVRRLIVDLLEITLDSEQDANAESCFTSHALAPALMDTFRALVVLMALCAQRRPSAPPPSARGRHPAEKALNGSPGASANPPCCCFCSRPHLCLIPTSAPTPPCHGPPPSFSARAGTCSLHR
jgi:hypothetical protein